MMMESKQMGALFIPTFLSRIRRFSQRRSE
jgi:hypothetical protein